MIKQNHAATGDMEVAATQFLNLQQHAVHQSLLGVLILRGLAFIAQLVAFAAFSMIVARLLANDASALAVSHFWGDAGFNVCSTILLSYNHCWSFRKEPGREFLSERC